VLLNLDQEYISQLKRYVCDIYTNIVKELGWWTLSQSAKDNEEYISELRRFYSIYLIVHTDNVYFSTVFKLLCLCDGIDDTLKAQIMESFKQYILSYIFIYKQYAAGTQRIQQ
jgi:hypothetical protein